MYIWLWCDSIHTYQLSVVQVKDMKERLEEAESMGVRRMKAQMQGMESRVASLEEQLDAATRSDISLKI